jgi:ParB/RepB/Spo0J family partition protein
MAKLRGLGQGLDALLGGDDNRGEDSLTQLAVGLLQPHCFQLRRRMDPQSIAELADSIKFQGLIQPIRVRPIDGGKYEIIAGERRWRAAQLAGLTQVPVVMRAVPDQTALAMALIENIQREDLTSLDEAAGILRLVDEFDMAHDAAAQAVGRSRTAASNLLRPRNRSNVSALNVSALSECNIEESRQAAPRDCHETVAATFLAALALQHGHDTVRYWPLGYEGAFASFEESLDEFLHDGPLSYEAACAWLEESLDESAHDGLLDFDAACAWLESTTRTAGLTTQSVCAAAIPMVLEELRSNSK